jgi:catechol 2,3-dioxygenase-like lactoylglutathione lyase family enzyme
MEDRRTAENRLGEAGARAAGQRYRREPGILVRSTWLCDPYRRLEEAFAYLERPEGAQIMLSQRSGEWETAALDRPYGRGAMFQVYVAGIEPVAHSLEAAGWPLYAGPREVWREVGDRQAGQREIFVLDPDGYLVMVADNPGERPLSDGARL